MKVTILTILALLHATNLQAAKGVPDSRAVFESALEQVHASGSRSNSRQQIMMTAANLRLSDPQSGFGETLLAEYLSTISLDQGGNLKEVFDEVMRLTNTANGLNPELAEAHVPAARALIRTALFFQAEDHLDLALQLSPNLPSAIFLVADLKRHIGKPLEAIADYKRFIEIVTPGRRQANGYYWMGQTYQQAALAEPQKRDELINLARQSYEKGIELDPQSPTKLANFANFLNQIGKADEAARVARQALSMQDFGFAHWQLALAEYQLLALELDRLERPELIERTMRIIEETQIPPADAAEYARQWPEVQARLEPLVNKVADIEQERLLNPNMTWEEGLKATDPTQRYVLFSEASMLWAQNDILQGLERVGELKNPVERQSIRQVLLSAAASAQPDVTLDLLPQLTDQNERSMVVTGAMRALAQHDPDSALSRVDELPSPLKGPGAQTVLETISAEDPRRAAQMYGDLPYRSQIPYRNLLVTNYVGINPREALQWAESLDGIGGGLWLETLGAIARHSPDQALEVLTAMPMGADREKVFEVVMSGLMLDDPVGAAKASEKLPEGPMRSNIAGNAVRKWAEIDPVEALSWTLTQPETISSEILPGLVYTLIETDLRVAAAVPIEEIPEAVRSRWIDSLVSPLAREDPVLALAWLVPFSNQPKYATWRYEVLSRLAERDPHKALAAAAEHMDETEYATAISHITASWATQDGMAASQWLDTEYSGNNRLPLTRNIAGSWYRKQPIPSEQWALSLNDVAQREQALIGIIANMDPASPKRAQLVRILQLENSLEQETELRLISLIETDPAAAAILLEELDLDQEVYEMYKNQIKSRQEAIRWHETRPH